MARAGVDACSPRPPTLLHRSEAPLGASAPAEAASATPSVLTKLQKWVRCLRGMLGGGSSAAAAAWECPFGGSKPFGI